MASIVNKDGTVWVGNSATSNEKMGIRSFGAALSLQERLFRMHLLARQRGWTDVLENAEELKKKTLEQLKDMAHDMFQKSLYNRTQVVDCTDFMNMILLGVGYSVISDNDKNCCMNNHIHSIGGPLSEGPEGNLTNMGYSNHDQPRRKLFLCKTCFESPHRTKVFLDHPSYIHGCAFRVLNTDYARYQQVKKTRIG